ncbi:MAG TPA: hypothetical protein VMX12_01610 [Acidimicrobiia bacterium]|nr:hypothetical protein [Acidimicrobiia bacterium]
MRTSSDPHPRGDPHPPGDPRPEGKIIELVTFEDDLTAARSALAPDPGA